MTGLKARGLSAAAIATAMSAVAFVAPGVASASCNGANIKGNGSSLQANAQQKYWSLVFNEKCAGPPATEQVEYIKTSSGKGLSSWGVGGSSNFQGFGAANAFVGTDQPPNQTQEEEILLNQSPVSTKVVLSIPVLQAAVALPTHLPENCTASGGKKGAVKRIVLSDATLQGIFAATITKWTEVPGVKCPTGDEPEIKRVVREEGSGTTAIVKKFLFEINSKAVDGTETWNELAEKNENLNWPDEGTVIREKKGSGITTEVATTAGTIGYANLNEVAENPAFPAGGGENQPTFWPLLDNKGTKYANPEKESNANCLNESYISLNREGHEGKFPPASTEDLWNEVTASTNQKSTYPLCGFTYDLALTDYHNFSTEKGTPSAAEVETLKNYFTFVTSEEGQKKLEKHDFLALPNSKKVGEVLKEAQEGVAKIGY